jgi:hypothetical protein
MKKLLIVLALLSSSAHAEFFTGNNLHEKLNSTDTLDRIHGMGFVQGVFDVYVNVTFCPPSNVTAGQVRDMVKNYLTNSPAIRNYAAESIINLALKQAWPCEQKKDKRL